jgi:GMP synthase (glutamine-hydrolysing)
MRTAIVITHVAFEDLGTFEGVLRDRGYAIDRLDAGVHDLARVVERDPDLLCVLGGPLSVNDQRDFPFLEQEVSLLRARLAKDRPTLGICLGAQLMSVALGGRVAPMRQKEIGFGPLRLTAEGAASALRHLGDESTVLHWHGEEYSLPEGAVLLATSPLCATQAFAWGANALGLQFHLEAEAQSLERWYVGHVVELGLVGVSITSLREQAARHGRALRERAQQVLAQWLDDRQL